MKPTTKYVWLPLVLLLLYMVLNMLGVYLVTLADELDCIATGHMVLDVIPLYEPMIVTHEKPRVEGWELFEITHYCACETCCGIWADGITKSGKPVEEGVTVAVDSDVIPLGTELYIESVGFVEAQDTGSAVKGNLIDVYIADHDRARTLGRYESYVLIGED